MYIFGWKDIMYHARDSETSLYFSDLIQFIAPSNIH